jgi:hypothetical protein
MIKIDQLLLVALGGLVIACLPLDTRFAGSNPAEDDGFLRVIKIRSTTSFGGEVSRRSHVADLRHIKKNLTSMKEMSCKQNSAAMIRC